MEIDLNTKLNVFGEISRLRLAKILGKIPGNKNFIIEPNLIKPLERICGVRWLQSNNIIKIYKIEEKLSLCLDNTQVFFISSHLHSLKHVLNEIEAIINSNPELNMTYHIIMVPKIINMYETIVEEVGLYGQVILHSFSWLFINLDVGLFSLELPLLFGDVFVNADLSLFPVIGKSLSSLFCAVGKPELVITIGKHAQNVYKHTEIFNEEFELPKDSDFGAMIIMDRSVDYVSALLTPVTYNGLLNEIFKINCGKVENKCFELENIQRLLKKNTQTLFSLDSENDLVYSDIKNRHISEVTNILSDQARKLKLENDLSKEMALNEIKTYLKTKLKNVAAHSKFLGHLNSCEKIIKELADKFEKIQTTELSFLQNFNKNANLTNLEDIICTENDYVSLRLLCLMSLTQKLTYNEYHNLKLRYLHRVGYQFLYMFHNLVNAGLILEPVQSKLSSLSLKLPSLSAKKDFYSVASKMKLVPPKPEEVNVRSPVCPSYVFGGSYVPVIAQIVSALLQSRTDKDFKAKLELFDGTLSVGGLTKPFPLQQRTVLVCMVGGVTYAEVAACDLVEKLHSCKVIVCSSSMVSGGDLLSSCA